MLIIRNDFPALYEYSSQIVSDLTPPLPVACYLINSVALVFTTFEITKHSTFAE